MAGLQVLVHLDTTGVEKKTFPFGGCYVRGRGITKFSHPCLTNAEATSLFGFITLKHLTLGCNTELTIFF